MRALSALLLLAALGATGALVATRLTGGPGPSAARLSGAGGADGSPAAERTSPAPPARAMGGPITVVVRTADGRILVRSRIGTMDPTRTSGGFAPIDPPEWNQAVWVRYRPLVSPADTSRGTAYLYGHACHHHVCAFTRLHEVTPGGSVTITAGGRTATYTVTSASGAYPKEGAGSLGSLRSGIADRAVRDRIVLVTCAYETGDLSLNNFVVVARRH